MRFCKLLFFLVASLIFVVAESCNKLVDPGIPLSRVTSAEVYSNDSLAMAVVNGVYTEVMKAFGPFNGNITRFCSLYSDELIRTSDYDKDTPFITGKLTADDQMVQQLWKSVYQYIYLSNDIIQGLNNSNAIKPPLRNRLLGEGYFIRAMCYFYLVNLFGDVPMITGTDYTVNAKIPRTPAGRIYEQMVNDLNQAETLLQVDYFTTNEYSFQRIHANKLAATALLARVYLYKKDWVAAETAATRVIQSTLYKLEANPQLTFLNVSSEAILQFMPISGYNSAEGAMFVPQSGTLPAFIIRDSLLMAFAHDDKRGQWIRMVQDNGIKYHSPFKYKLNEGSPLTEYNMVLRLAEQFLIRAEARIMQNKFTEAASDLNALRTRAGLIATGAFNSQADAMIALENERRIELFAEWGHRWFDLKRWPARNGALGPDATRADEVMSACKPLTWNSTARLWPIPANELKLNVSLVQNDGY